jgi:hypothetical protein
MKQFLLLAAFALCAAPAFAQGNTSSISQTGDDHLAENDQDGNGNFFTAIQNDGDENKIIDFDQIGDGNIANITQSGDNNEVDIAQQEGDVNGVNGGNQLTILQVGDRNEAGRDNGGAAPPDAIDQRGDNNIGELTQLGDDNVIFLEQTGNDNNALVTQGKEGGLQATENVAAVTQKNGDWNDVDIDVQAGQENEMYVVQDGNWNKAGIFNGSDPIPDAIDQQGDFNDAHLLQDGDHNTMYLEQFGDYNDAQMNQFGDSNTATVYQMGNGALAEVDQGTFGQNANGNTATVSQN